MNMMILSVALTNFAHKKYSTISSKMRKSLDNVGSLLVCLAACWSWTEINNVLQGLNNLECNVLIHMEHVDCIECVHY